LRGERKEEEEEDDNKDEEIHSCRVVSSHDIFLDREIEREREKSILVYLCW